MLALILGPDAALARREASRLVATHDPDGTNTSLLDGREASLGQIIAAVGCVGFFGGRRVVVVSDLLARATRGGKSGGIDDEAITGQPTAAIDLSPLFAAVPEQNVLILVDASLTAVPAAIKRLVPSDALVIAADPPRGRQLLAWLKASARELGGELDDRTAQFLAETLFPQTWANRPANPRFDRPPNTAHLGNEIAKLVTAAHPGPITHDHVRALVTGAADDRVFRFIEAATEGRLGPALGELEQLTLAGEEPAKVAAQLQQQIELTAVAAAGYGKEPLTIGRELGLANPNRMAGIAASRIGQDQVRAFAAIAAAVATDRGLKRGQLRQPDDVLYGLLAATSAIPGKRGSPR